MELGLGLLILLAVVALIAGPVLAIVALSRISDLRHQAQQIAQLTSRVYHLEQRLAAADPTFEQSPDATATKSSGPVRAPGAPTSPVSVPPPVPSLSQPSDTPPVPAAAPAIPSPSPPGAAPPGSIAPAAARRSTLPAVSSAPRPGTDVEAILGGRWLYYVGILALLFAVAFFLKFAFDNNWIGPGGRIGIGILMGGAMFPLSDWLLHRGYHYFSEGITGLGSAVLYLSVWAGWHYYALFSPPAAFGLMIVITGLTAAVAVGRRSERIAVLAMAGGALTPLLVSTGENAEFTLFSYLAILGAAMLVLSWAKSWKWLPPLQFAATLVYFWGWYSEFYAKDELAITLVFASVFFAMFAVLPAVRSLRHRQPANAEIGVVIANSLQYLIALRLMLWPEYRWGLALTVLALAGLHLVAARVLAAENSKNSRLPRILYEALALMFATVAIPILLEGPWITIAWATEGAALVWSGLRVRSFMLRASGILLLAIAAIRLAAIPLAPGSTFLLNARFLSMSVCAACLLGAFRFAWRARVHLGSAEMHVYYLLAVAANIFFLTALSLDVWDLYGRMPSLGIDRSLAQNLALSVLWLVYALLLLAGGVIKKSAVARWQALALLGVVVVKVFFFDLSFLARFYRIVSFLLLGIALLLVSFFYQRRSASQANEKS